MLTQDTRGSAMEVYQSERYGRQGSPTFGKWVSVTLSSERRHLVYIPEGFAHGFCVTSETAVCLYKCTDYYAPTEERGIRWDDPSLKIMWPVPAPLLSEKDRVYPTLNSVQDGDLPEFKPTDALKFQRI